MKGLSVGGADGFGHGAKAGIPVVRMLVRKRV